MLMAKVSASSLTGRGCHELPLPLHDSAVGDADDLVRLVRKVGPRNAVLYAHHGGITASAMLSFIERNQHMFAAADEPFEKIVVYPCYPIGSGSYVKSGLAPERF